MSYDLAKFKHGLEELRITLTDHQFLSTEMAFCSIWCAL